MVGEGILQCLQLAGSFVKQNSGILCVVLYMSEYLKNAIHFRITIRYNKNLVLLYCAQYYHLVFTCKAANSQTISRMQLP